MDQARFLISQKQKAENHLLKASGSAGKKVIIFLSNGGKSFQMEGQRSFPAGKIINSCPAVMQEQAVDMLMTNLGPLFRISFPSKAKVYTPGVLDWRRKISVDN